MCRVIVTDIPVAPRVSGILELAGVANLWLALNPPRDIPTASAAVLDAYYARMLPEWAEEFTARAKRAAARLHGWAPGGRLGEKRGRRPRSCIAVEIGSREIHTTSQGSANGFGCGFAGVAVRISSRN